MEGIPLEQGVTEQIKVTCKFSHNKRNVKIKLEDRLTRLFALRSVLYSIPLKNQLELVQYAKKAIVKKINAAKLKPNDPTACLIVADCCRQITCEYLKDKNPPVPDFFKDRETMDFLEKKEVQTLFSFLCEECKNKINTELCYSTYIKYLPEKDKQRVKEDLFDAVIVKLSYLIQTAWYHFIEAEKFHCYPIKRICLNTINDYIRENHALGLEYTTIGVEGVVTQKKGPDNKTEVIPEPSGLQEGFEKKIKIRLINEKIEDFILHDWDASPVEKRALYQIFMNDRKKSDVAKESGKSNAWVSRLQKKFIHALEINSSEIITLMEEL